MQKTTTNKAPEVSLSTPVSVRIGSDQYAAHVVRVTAATVVVRFGLDLVTCRPYTSKSTRTYSETTKTFEYVKGWRSPHGCYLVVGACETKLDPCF